MSGQHTGPLDQAPESAPMIERTPRFPQSLAYVFGSLWRHRSLVFQLARRDVLGRYRGSYLGLLWSFFSPLLMLSVYTFVFGIVFGTRWGQATGGSRAEFAVVLFTGLVVFGIFSECVNRAPGLVIAHANFVKRVVFPLEILPWVALGSSLFHAAVNFVVLLLAHLAVFSVAPVGWIWLPVVLAPLVLLTLGVSWMLASIGVFLRDVAQTVQVLVAALLFMSPIFYPVSALPEPYRPLLYLNPLTLIVEQARAVLVWGQPPDLRALALHALFDLAVAWLGLAWFQRTRSGFADVL